MPPFFEFGHPEMMFYLSSPVCHFPILNSRNEEILPQKIPYLVYRIFLYTIGGMSRKKCLGGGTKRGWNGGVLFEAEEAEKREDYFGEETNLSPSMWWI